MVCHREEAAAVYCGSLLYFFHRKVQKNVTVQSQAKFHKTGVKCLHF